MSSDANFEVVIVKYGTMPSARKSDVYLNFHIYGIPDETIGMDYFLWVIRDGERVVVVDTGFSADGGAKRDRTVLLRPDDACRKLGVEPHEVETVILTHAHYDHAGNLSAFPNAEIYLAANDYYFWTGPHAHRRLFRPSIEDADIDHLRTVKRQGRLRLWKDQLRPFDGLQLIELGGHSPGQSVVLVNTSDGPVLLASDAVHYYEEYEEEMPFSVVTDVVGMYEGFLAIKDMMATGAVKHLVTGHDPSTLSLFTPMGGELAGLAATIGGQR